MTNLTQEIAYTEKDSIQSNDPKIGGVPKNFLFSFSLKF